MLSILGEALGIGMQINNDVYDLFNSLEKTEKDVVGLDISEGKKYLLVIHSYYNGTSKVKEEKLLEILSLRIKYKMLANDAIEILKENGSLDYAKKVGNDLMIRTWGELKSHVPNKQAKEDLSSLIDYYVNILHKITCSSMLNAFILLLSCS